MIIKNRELSLELANATVNERFMQLHAGVVYDVAGVKIIGGIDHDIVTGDDFERVIGS